MSRMRKRFLESELTRVTGDESIVVHPDGAVGWLDPETGAGDVYGSWVNIEGVIEVLRYLPDWKGDTAGAADWSDLGIPMFDR